MFYDVLGTEALETGEAQLIFNIFQVPLEALGWQVDKLVGWFGW